MRAPRDGGPTAEFVALHVGRNQMRKNHPHLLEGWAKFVRGLSATDAAKVRLYLHTEETQAPDLQDVDPHMGAYRSVQLGHNLPAVIERYCADVKETIRFSERNVRDADLRMLYRAADVCVNVAQGEGFGLINIEAPACGRAIIAADNTTTPELLGGAEARWSAMDAYAVWEEGIDFDALPVPYAYRVPCSAWMLQPDILARRWFPDTDALADAIDDAFIEWEGGHLNDPRVEERRRDWTVARYGWAIARDAWVELIKSLAARRSGR
jgi:glycosyltransferase involved in cell wall biosynthesis